MRSHVPLALALLLGGCFANVETPFPEGLEPLADEHLAPDPAGTPGDPYPEELAFARADGRRGLFIHARGFVHAGVATTFAAVRNPGAGSARRIGTEATFEHDVDPNVPYSFVAHNVAYDIITVEWDTTWRSAEIEGSVEMPELTSTRWQKTYGSTTITTMEGSILCRRRADGVTQVDFQYRLDALATSWATVEDYLEGYYEAILSLVHRGELPPQRP